MFIDFKQLESAVHEYKGLKRLPTIIADVSSIVRLMKGTDAYLGSVRKSIKNRKLWTQIFSIQGLRSQGIVFRELEEAMNSSRSRRKS